MQPNPELNAHMCKDGQIGHSELNMPGWPIPPSCDFCHWIDDSDTYPPEEYRKQLVRHGYYERLKIGAIFPTDRIPDSALFGPILKHYAYDAELRGQLRLAPGAEMIDITSETQTNRWPNEDGTFDQIFVLMGYILGTDLTKDTN
jgi:hypothetical protein